LPGVPGVKMTRRSSRRPADKPAWAAGDLQLQVVNTGSTTLTNVVVTDNFPSAKLSYTSASQTPRPLQRES